MSTMAAVKQSPLKSFSNHFSFTLMENVMRSVAMFPLIIKPISREHLKSRKKENRTQECFLECKLQFCQWVAVWATYMAVINSRGSRSCIPEDKTWQHSITVFHLKLLFCSTDEFQEYFGLHIAPHVPVVFVIIYIFVHLGNIQEDGGISFLYYCYSTTSSGEQNQQIMPKIHRKSLLSLAESLTSEHLQPCSLNSLDYHSCAVFPPSPFNPTFLHLH